MTNMIFKVDFAKAYDSITWDYLDDVLKSFRFGVKWRSWIHGSLNSSKAFILVNGSPTSEFQFHRGLKQGDPLAPFLFILIMGSLHLSFTRAVEAGIFKGIRINESLMISHLFYADDALFIGEWSNENLQGWRKKIAWVKWQSVLAAKKHGGLGVSSFFALNRGLLAKIRIGNGVHTCFWKDFWIGDTRLQGMFPRLYALESYKDISVADKIRAPLYTSFRRDVRGGAEASQLAHLSALLATVTLSQSEDRWTCDLNGEGVFNV
ncbi:RNA-directed DNA polymerase, eukaryota [Tanacetum coccineum]